ncbi:hypothetical protein [Spartinivicinus ruber]|uniref:hypothetical protein n=1 Tax=Spartinivicinus ruber TaxID=2683272 RepID=UPI0013D35C51|nr:hypothetical protein [Spartinivicinus ruber]
MSSTWINQAKKLIYKDPKGFLIRLREFESYLAISNTPVNIKTLRTNKLKQWRELREAAIFCYGMNVKLNKTIHCATSESQDYDFVAKIVEGTKYTLCPVQLKEVVPTDINPSATIEKVINNLDKYVDSQNLTVAIHLNQVGSFDFDSLIIPKLNIASLWVFGSISSDQSKWGIWGDFITPPVIGTSFDYPQ